MGRHSKNLKIEMHQKLDSLLRIGQSKHAAKKDYRARCEAKGEKWNPAQAEGIYSIRTADKYRQTINEFTKWCKENYPDIKKLSQLTKEIAYEYLQQREKEGKSAYTLSTDMSALNKITNLKLTKDESKLKERKLEEITRSRNTAKMDAHVNENNYKKQILMARAFGCRRESIVGGNYQLKEGIGLYQDEKGDVYCRMIEKGGKYREAPCRSDLKDEVLRTFDIKNGTKITKQEFIQVYNSSKENIMFDLYSKNVDNHAFRAEYATKLYNQLAERYPYAPKVIGFNKYAAEEVSKALGHNRISVIKHYIRKGEIDHE